MAVASLVLGIVALVFGIFGFGMLYWLGIVLGIIGLILAIVAKKQGQKGIATAGLVLNIIAVALSIIFWVACAICVSSVDAAAIAGALA